ncbi:MAG: DUF4405 domain-containing protein [Calditrichaeota bacterium]|nr:MAG: DUF4405 domain-containing protein [Calditrichota bacterium]
MGKSNMRDHENNSTLKALFQPIKEFMNERLPKGVGLPHTLGSSLLALIVVQLVTGILLAIYYSPNAAVAYDSVKYIEGYVLFGKLIRGIHHFAASAFVIIIALHLLRTYFYGAYKKPRQFNWISGVLLLLIVLGFAFTGYLLPWDMKAYFATKVGINVGGSVPVVGHFLVKLLQGGSKMGSLTLTRFYALHIIILPLGLILLAGLHVVLIRLHGPTPPWRKEGEPVEYGHRFFPRQLFLDTLVASTVILVVVLLAAKYGAPLDPKADPNNTSYVPRPDWYFYGLFQLLKIFEGRLEFIGAVVIPGLFFTLLILLPFLDKNPERDLIRRPFISSLGASTTLVILVLTVWGAAEGQKSKKQFEANLADKARKPEAEMVADVDQGETLFMELKCAACHLLPSQEENIPPGLEFAGNKYQVSWLRDFLREPYRIRWIKKNQRPLVRMPNFDLSATEAANLAGYLMTYKMDFKFPAVDMDWTETDNDMVESGKDLFGELGCNSCHTLQGSGGKIGPDLSHVGSKLQENYMFHLIKSPDKIIPGTPMKDFKLEDDDVIDLVAYLKSLK